MITHDSFKVESGDQEIRISFFKFRVENPKNSEFYKVD